MHTVQIINKCVILLLLFIVAYTFKTEGLTLHFVLHCINICTYVLTTSRTEIIEMTIKCIVTLCLISVLLFSTIYIYLQNGIDIHFIISFLNICIFIFYLVNVYLTKKKKSVFVDLLDISIKID